MNDETEAPVGGSREEQRKAIEDLRQDCLARLRALGVKKVKAKYDGYANEGEINTVKVKPKRITVEDDLQDKLMDLIWFLVQEANPNFEDNNGGRGNVKWTVRDDHIIIWHWDRIVTEIFSEHEGV